MRHFSEILQVIPIFCDYQLLIYFPLNSQQQISLPNYLLVRQAHNKDVIQIYLKPT